MEEGYQDIKLLKNRKTGFETSFITNISADGSTVVPIYASTSDDNTEGTFVSDMGEMVMGEKGTLEINSSKRQENRMTRLQKIYSEDGEVLATTYTQIDNEEDSIHVYALSLEEDIAKARAEFIVGYSADGNDHMVRTLDDKALTILTYQSKDGVEDLSSARVHHVVDTVSFILDTFASDVFTLDHYQKGDVVLEDMQGKLNERTMVADDNLRSISVPHDGAGRVDSYTYYHGSGYQQISKFDDRMSHAECIIVFEMDKEDLQVRPAYFTAYSENPELKFGFYPNKPFALFQYTIETSVNADGSLLKRFDLISPQGEFLGHSELLI